MFAAGDNVQISCTGTAWRRFADATARRVLRVAETKATTACGDVASDAIESHGASALADQLARRVGVGKRRGQRPRIAEDGFDSHRGFSLRDCNGFINHRPLDVG